MGFVNSCFDGRCLAAVMVSSPLPNGQKNAIRPRPTKAVMMREASDMIAILAEMRGGFKGALLARPDDAGDPVDPLQGAGLSSARR